MAVLQTWDEIVASTLNSDGSIREDLQDSITNVTPYETPILSQLQQVGVNQNFVQWLTDVFAAAAANAHTEGIAHTGQAQTVPSRAANTTQIFYKGGTISDRTDMTVHAGMQDPVAYYEGKNVIEIKKDIELALVKGSAITGDTDTASQLGGFMNVLSTNKTAVSGITMTELVFGNLLELTWGNTEVQPSEVYCGAKLKRTISQYSTKVTRNVDANAKKQVLTVEQYDSDFGMLNVHLHRNLANVSGNSELLAIDPRFYATGWLQPLRREILARDGKRTRYQISCDLTLLYGNEKAGMAASQLSEYVT